MDDLKVCRICLRIDKFAKYYNLQEFFLKCYYEEITAAPVTNNDGLPKYFCYQCAAILNKYHFFKEKCCFTQQTLKHMARTAPLTYDKISNMDSRQMPIIKRGNIDIIKANKKVKTYNIEFQKEVLQSKNQNRASQCDDFECYIDFYECDTSSDNDVLSGLKKEDTRSVKIISKEDSNGKLDQEPAVSDPAKDVEEKKEESKILQKLLSNPPKKKKSTFSKKKSSNVAHEPETEKRKFTKSMGVKLKVLQFLDSGFWRKIMLTEVEAKKEFHAKGQNEKYLHAVYKCSDCYKGFSQENMLNVHLLKKHGEAVGSFICRFCKTRFRWPYLLSEHMKQHLTKYECLRCNLVCNVETTAMLHEQYHNGVIRKCPHCDKEYKHLSTFYTHLRTHRSNHMCSLCGKSFVSPLGLHHHKRLKHVIELENHDMPDDTYCDVCKIKFETAEAYNTHLIHSALHSGNKGDTPVKEIMRHGEDMDIKEGMQNMEEQCVRKAELGNSLSAVRKTNLNNPPWKYSKKPSTCQHCGKHFETKKACLKHHHAEHRRKPFYSSNDRIICETCGVSLAPSSVAAHLNQHTRRKLFTCDTCGKSFISKKTLTSHIASHTGERNHVCKICGKRFAHSGSLSNHHNMVHLKRSYPKRNKRIRIQVPTSDAGPFGDKEEYRMWTQHYFNNSTYSNS